MPGMTFQQLAAAFRREMIYWGISSAPANTQTFIKSLSGKMPAVPNYQVQFAVNVTGANKLYFALPDRFGAVTFLDVINSVAGGLSVRASGISYTGTDGLTQGYSLCESALAGLGPMTVLTSWRS